MRRRLHDLRQAVLRAARGGLERLLERRFGVETEEQVSLEEIGLEGDGRLSYEASSWLLLPALLRGRRVSDRDVFVDLGAGKGRMLLSAGRHPFGRVVGVELSADPAAVARRNAELARDSLRCQTIEVVTADIRDYELPADATIVFMFNPFRGELIDVAMEKVVASFDRAPRRVELVYHNPTEHERVLASGRVRLVRELPRGRWLPARLFNMATTHVYEVVPPSGGG
jgi:predicted RNA methylase